MELTAEQKAEIARRIATYEARRDQLLGELNVCQGVLLALREMLQTEEPPAKTE